MRLMLPDERRSRLAELVQQHRACRKGLSRFLGRGDSYVSDYLTRSVPYDLAETDRELLARYFGVDKDTLRPAPTRPRRNARDRAHWQRL